MKKLSFILTFGLASILCFSRKAVSQENPFITFEYMHVKPGNDNAYMQVENFWRHIHMAQQKKGIILGWSVWEVVAPYNMTAPYQYVVTTVYPHFSNILHPYQGIDTKRIFPDASEDSLNKMFSETGKARDLIRRDIFSPETHVGNIAEKTVHYMAVTYDKVLPAKEQGFQSFMKDHFKPLVEKVVKRGFADFWWYGWQMFDPGVNSPHNVITVVQWKRDNMFDKKPPFAEYRKEDPAAFEGFKWSSRDRSELLHKVISLASPAK